MHYYFGYSFGITTKAYTKIIKETIKEYTKKEDKKLLNNLMKGSVNKPTDWPAIRNNVRKGLLPGYTPEQYAVLNDFITRVQTKINVSDSGSSLPVVERTPSGSFKKVAQAAVVSAPTVPPLGTVVTTAESVPVAAPVQRSSLSSRLSQRLSLLPRIPSIPRIIKRDPDEEDGAFGRRRSRRRSRKKRKSKRRGRKSRKKKKSRRKKRRHRSRSTSRYLSHRPINVGFYVYLIPFVFDRLVGDLLYT